MSVLYLTISMKFCKLWISSEWSVFDGSVTANFKGKWYIRGIIISEKLGWKRSSSAQVYEWIIERLRKRALMKSVVKHSESVGGHRSQISHEARRRELLSYFDRAYRPIYSRRVAWIRPIYSSREIFSRCREWRENNSRTNGGNVDDFDEIHRPLAPWSEVKLEWGCHIVPRTSPFRITSAKFRNVSFRFSMCPFYQFHTFLASRAYLKCILLLWNGIFLYLASRGFF